MSLKYIRLYPQDYLQDTNHLNTEEHGAYLLLIINYWQTERPLKDDNKRLAGICRMPSERWLDIRETIEEFFDVSDGLWSHKRIEHELFMVDRKSTQAREAGKKGGIKKAENHRLASGCLADVKRPSSDTDTDTDTDTNIKTKDNSITSSPPVSDPPRKKVPFEEIKNLYHKILPELPECKKLTDKRKGYIRARWNNGLPDIEHWEKFFNAVRGSKFLMGAAPAGYNRSKPFIANLEWITNPSNYVKIFEGYYHE